MRFWAHDAHGFPLPPGHSFPLGKYRLLRERLLSSGAVAASDICASPAAAWSSLGRVHADGYLDRVRTGGLSDREIRVLGLPWSAALVERGRRSTQGTAEAAADALAGGFGMNLGGGTHHAARASGRGYCLFNDVAVAVASLRADGFAGSVAVIDCDVHQGDGTAELFASDPSVFTLSIHGGANYPFRRATSSLDIDLRDGVADDEYLSVLAGALDRVAPTPALVFYLAAADPWEGDRLGRLALTKDGLAARDALVLDRCAAWGAAVCVVLAGGYAPDLEDTVDINAATVRAVLERSGVGV